MTDLLPRLAAALADRYRIERELGQGGMATVYLAEDLKHRRRVAIKVLKPELGAAIGSERFLREIETTANLRHPHILPLYDSGKAGDFLFYVMPLVEGESLRDRLKREKQLPLDDALQIAREVGDALSYAHSRGVIHRDIKPENILLESGHAVVADFGIAKAISAAGGEGLTLTGMAIGTPQYMSPEQAAGEKELDGRSDLYSLGCVLFEMLAGQPPFTGPTVESVVHQHLTATAPPITQLRPAVPAEVAAALQRALAKTPADRFNPVAQFAEALRPGNRPQTAPPVATPSGSAGARRRWVLAGVGLLVVAGAFALWRRGARVGADGSPSVAVLPFVDLSPNRTSEYLGDGMAETLINALANVPGLNVAARTSAFSFRGKNVDVRDIGRELGVGAVLEGSVQRSGARLRVTAQLIKTADGLHLWSENFDRDAADIFAVQDQVAQAVVSALQIKLVDASDSSLTSHGTRSVSAYDAYLLGRFLWGKRTAPDLVRAAAAFEEAIRADSNYAQAWSGLADSYVLFLPAEYDVPGINPDSILTLAERAARRAIALAPQRGEPYSSLGEVLEYRRKWAEARAAFERGVALSPRYPTAHLWYGYDLIAWNRWDEAVGEMERARELDPLSVVTTVSLAAAYDGAGRFSDADAMWERARELAPDHLLVLFFGSYHDLFRRDFARLAIDYPRLLELTGTDSAIADSMGRRLRDPARRDAALRATLNDSGARLSWHAMVLEALDGDDSVTRYLSEAANDPRVIDPTRSDFGTLVICGCLPLRLREDPRMKAVMVRMGRPNR